MDTRLQKLAKELRATYTRYADDITFSTTARVIPSQLGRHDPLDGSKIVLGVELATAIKENGFEINERKVRLQCRDCRQEVTGLTVNRFPNVPRRHIRRIQAMLHAWQKFGLEKAEIVHHQKFYSRDQGPGRDLPKFQQVVKGNIDYVGMIRGRQDPVYRKLVDWYAALNPSYQRRPSSGLGAKNHHELSQCLWVLESDESSIADVKDHQYLQGTGFLLSGIGLVTCDHVLRKDTYAHPAAHPGERHKVKILWRDARRDLAILQLKGVGSGMSTLTTCSGRPYAGQRIILAGFPRYTDGDEAHIIGGNINRFRMRSGVRRFLVDVPIVRGNSGGPIVDDRFQVVGVAVTGADSEASIDAPEDYGVVPVAEIIKMWEEYRAQKKVETSV